MSGPTVVVQGADGRRTVLGARLADVVDELRQYENVIEALHTGRLIVHVSQGSVALEVCHRFPNRKRTRDTT